MLYKIWRLKGLLNPPQRTKKACFSQVCMSVSVSQDLYEPVQPARCAHYHAELEHTAVVQQKPEGGNKFRLKFSNRYRSAN